jgi:deoxyribonuclease-2
MPLSAIDEDGNPVDWWFMYKVSGKSTASDGSKNPTLDGKRVTGTEYLYFDANTPGDQKLALSSHHVDQDGALPNTLAQLYGADAEANTHLGWFFYNDENPINGKTNGARGHTKGVLAFDLGNDSAFWLIHSVPKFAPKDEYGYPNTGKPNAQTLLCITLESADVALALAHQMYTAQQPNVYLASAIPIDLANQPDDWRVMLMQNQAASGSTPVAGTVPFLSKGGMKFTCMAKNKTWGLDFYNDLVGPTLDEDLDVETWEHDPTPGPLEADKIHKIVETKDVDLTPLGIDLAWPEPDDHAKLAISDKVEQVHYICVGDINFTLAQRKRGGGTVGFMCEPLWSSISSILKPGSVTQMARVSPAPDAITVPIKGKPMRPAKAKAAVATKVKKSKT